MKTENYIQLQPTDWNRGAGSTIITKNGSINLSDEGRLSCDIDIEKKFENNELENKIESIASNSNSQLLYSIDDNYTTEYPWVADRFSGKSYEKMERKKNQNLDPEILLERLIKAHTNIKSNSKPTVLFTTQKIAMEQKFLKDKYPNVEFVDLTKEGIDLSKMKDKIIIAYTGLLREPFFEKVLLKSTNFPPIIEGCNSRESCEKEGRPFIYSTGGGYKEKLKTYDVKDENSQELHNKASNVLKFEDNEDTKPLEEYMNKCISKENTIMEYHKDRQKKFLERKDSVEISLSKLDISYTKKSAHIDKSERLINNIIKKMRIFTKYNCSTLTTENNTIIPYTPKYTPKITLESHIPKNNNNMPFNLF